ncbi:MAG: Crp/Fnr family transcriptional regulator [Xanthomonadaceae bacterium]|nr:Crp/Fnr family transcriptional regulator [Xanthomonadaceae bacterium]
MATVAPTSLSVLASPACVAAQENRLLGGLAEENLARIVAVSEFARFEGDVHLAGCGDKLTRVYFPVSGYASLVVTDATKSQMQIGLVGSEGVFGWESFTGLDQLLFDVYVPETLRALSVDVGVFRSVLADNEHWMMMHLEYLSRLFSVAARGVLCARFHTLEARLARFLLEVDDRHPGKPILLTQSTLSRLLGVRRSGVTNAATHLQLLGLINYRRGQIVIGNRHELETAACDCYRYRIAHRSRRPST